MFFKIHGFVLLDHANLPDCTLKMVKFVGIYIKTIDFINFMKMLFDPGRGRKILPLIWAPSHMSLYIRPENKLILYLAG